MASIGPSTSAYLELRKKGYLKKCPSIENSTNKIMNFLVKPSTGNIHRMGWLLDTCNQEKQQTTVV